MSSLTYQIDNCPVILSSLKMLNRQFGQFSPSQAAAQENCKESPVPLSLQGFRFRCLPKHTSLFSCQPISQSAPKSLCAFHSTNAGSEVGAQQSRIGGFVGKAPYGSKPDVNGSCSEMSIFKVKSITENDRPV
jgi:hypothetical protein